MKKITFVTVLISTLLLLPSLSFAHVSEPIVLGKRGRDHINTADIKGFGLEKKDLTKADWRALRLRKKRAFTSFFVTEETLEQDLDVKIPKAEVFLKVFASEAANESLAYRIQSMRSANYTLDIAYFIFKNDHIGYAFLYEVCRAHERGVDVRLLIDHLGAISISKPMLKSLYKCKAGYLKDPLTGKPTKIKAQMQVVIFNPLFNIVDRLRSLSRRVYNFTAGIVFGHEVSLLKPWWNRRLHEKIILADGLELKNASIITGGRNISEDYYDFTKDIKSKFARYRDMDVAIKNANPEASEEPQISRQYYEYFDKLFQHLGNNLLNSPFKELRPSGKLRKMESSYRNLMSSSIMNNQSGTGLMQKGPLASYPKDFYTRARVQFTHEIHNLFSSNVTRKWLTNDQKNPNSVDLEWKRNIFKSKRRVLIVSPYVFFRKTTEKIGRSRDHLSLSEENKKKIIENGKHFELANEYADIQRLLLENPDLTFEIITGSVLTSDNLFTQAIIDQEVVPELHTYQGDEALRNSKYFENKKSENKKVGKNLLSNKEIQEIADNNVLSRADWEKVIATGRVKVWEYGSLNDERIGGDTRYGKVHSKFAVFDDKRSLITTSNFDWRSRDYNSESGIFIESEEVNKELWREAELLKSQSLLWGSPEWKEMKEKSKGRKGFKGFLIRNQESVYEFITFFSFIYWNL